jgi:hypothetical protein
MSMCIHLLAVLLDCLIHLVTFDLSKVIDSNVEHLTYLYSEYFGVTVLTSSSVEKAKGISLVTRSQLSDQQQIHTVTHSYVPVFGLVIEIPLNNISHSSVLIHLKQPSHEAFDTAQTRHIHPRPLFHDANVLTTKVYHATTL